MKYFVIYLQTFLTTLFEFYRQKKFINQYAKKYIVELESKFEDKFSDKLKQKIISYYALFVPIMVCKAYYDLYGVEYTISDRKLATQLGILTPIYDDLFDEENLTGEEIKNVVLHGEIYPPQTLLAKVGHYIFLELLKNNLSNDEYKMHFNNLVQSQIDSLRQTDITTTLSELEKITYQKGGASYIFYHQTIFKKENRELYNLLSLSGGLLQTVNDILDIHKDLSEGVFTVPNRCEDFEAFRKLFVERIIIHNKKLFDLPFNLKNKIVFSIIINLIHARGLVALDHFVKLEKKIGPKLNLMSLDRKYKIVDMETVPNFLKWMKYCYQIPKWGMDGK
jgi:hypothetical protein